MAKSTVATTTSISNTTMLEGIQKRENANGEEYFQAIFSQMITLKERAASTLLQIFNASDPRFAGPKRRKAWIKIGIPEAIKYAGITEKQLENLQVEETLELDLEDFRIEGQQVNIQLLEYTKSEVQALIDKATSPKVKANWQYLLDNEEKTAKQIPDSGEYFTSNGEIIFQKQELVMSEPSHKIIADTVKTPYDEIFTKKAIPKNIPKIVGQK